MKKIIVIALLLFAFGMSSQAQMIGATNNQGTYGTTGYSGQYRPGLAWLESFLVPGLGQMLENKQYTKGLCMLGGYVACLGVGSAMLEDGDDEIGPVFLVAGVAIWIWSQIDAPVTANRLNRGGYYSFDLGEGRELDVAPAMDYVSLPLASTGTMTTGMKVSLKF